VQITNGLTAGDMVITSGNYALDEGTKVKVASADAEDSKKPDAAKEDK
jgi:hypothetical protein